MGKFTGYLFCTDCDGTLTDENLEVSKENAQAIKYFQSEGGRFTVATGRNPDYIEALSMGFKPNAPIIVVNGALLYDLDTKKDVCAVPIGADVNELIKFAFELPEVGYISIAGNRGNMGNYVKKGIKVLDNELQVNSADEIIKHMKSFDKEVLRVFFVQHENVTVNVYNQIKSRFADNFSTVMGWKEGVECMALGCGKGSMISKLKAYFDDEIKLVVAAGDYHNDISMFKVADISYAVSNAPEFVRLYASRSAPSNNESAIAYIITELEMGLR